MKYRICIFTSNLSQPFDEGVKEFAISIAKELWRQHEVIALCLKGESNLLVRRIRTNRFLLLTLRGELRRFNPDFVIYLPNASVNIFSLYRAKLLKFFARRAKIIVIALQPSKYGFISKRIIPLMMPDLIFVQSMNTLKNLSQLGCKVKLIPTGIDIQKFSPVKGEVKKDLRKKYGINRDSYVVLHVGHINRNRNVQLLKQVQKASNNQLLLVGSTSTPHDKQLVKALNADGIRIITEYLSNIQEIYQLSDCYIFPVHFPTASIEIPFSVMEAMACNLPIVSTLFQGLPSLFKERNGFYFAQGHSEFIDKISKIRELDPKDIKTREMVKTYSWENVVNLVWDKCMKYFPLDRK